MPRRLLLPALASVLAALVAVFALAAPRPAPQPAPAAAPAVAPSRPTQVDRLIERAAPLLEVKIASLRARDG